MNKRSDKKDVLVVVLGAAIFFALIIFLLIFFLFSFAEGAVL